MKFLIHINCNIFVFRAKKLDLSQDNIYELLKELGRLYDYNTGNLTKLQELHDLLVKYNGSTTYNITNVMLDVSYLYYQNISILTRY